MTCNKSKVGSRMTVVLILIVVLELILIGHQVQSVKTIKKKMLVKKFKKLLPLLALLKPKKKIVLLPIPIPMYSQDQGMESFGMEAYDMPIDMQAYSSSAGGYMGGSSSSAGV